MLKTEANSLSTQMVAARFSEKPKMIIFYAVTIQTTATLATSVTRA
jgi:hypothetical protein